MLFDQFKKLDIRCIRRWIALKAAYSRGLNKIAEEEFGRLKRNYKKLDRKKKKLVEKKYNKRYPRALIKNPKVFDHYLVSGHKKLKSLAFLKKKIDFDRICSDHTHASKKPTTTKEAKWRRSFLRNILERRAVYLKKEGERKKWRKEHREERKERRKKRKKEKEENTLTWGKSKTRKTFIKKQNRINKNR